MKKNGNRVLAHGKVRTAMRMNKTEAAYAKHLELRRCAGEVLWWRFEGIRLRIGHSANYTPDFAVLVTDGTLELHETKGTWSARGQTAAKVRLRAAADMFPFRFVVAMRDGAGWTYEEF